MNMIKLFALAVKLELSYRRAYKALDGVIKSINQKGYAAVISEDGRATALARSNGLIWGQDPKMAVDIATARRCILGEDRDYQASAEYGSKIEVAA